MTSSPSVRACTPSIIRLASSFSCSFCRFAASIWRRSAMARWMSVLAISE
jgi:hypothetical protein